MIVTFRVMSSRPLWPLLLLCVLLPLVCGLLPGQSAIGGGVIQGTVRDTTHAAIPAARIFIAHEATGIVTRTETNHDGFFITPTLPIGQYKVRVEFTGMKTWVGGLTVEAGKTAEVSPALAPGDVTETITVAAAAPLVTTTEPTEGATLDAQRIADLPVNGRSLDTLLLDVTPGLEGGNGALRAGGLMLYSTTVTQDGAPATDRQFGGSENVQGLESMGEVRVETSTSSAKLSTPASVIVTTKSGGNQIHMSAYETLRNNAFGVARARQDVYYDGRKFEVPKLIRNEFGGSIGGPVLLPSFGLNGRKFYDGHNRTFFFFTREGLELRQGLSADFKVPTMAMRRGDFSQLYDSQGRFISIYDPLTSQIVASGARHVTTRLPFTGNIIPASRMSPVAKYVYGIMPEPTDATNPLVGNNLKMVVVRQAAPVQSNNPTTVRLDHRFSGNDNIFVKFNGGNFATHYQGTASLANVPTLNQEANMTYSTSDGIAGAFSWTHIFGPTFFVETNGTRSSTSTALVNGPVQKNWANDLGLPNPYGQIGWPYLSNMDFTNLTEGDGQRWFRCLTDNWEQNYTLIRRTHNLQFGWRFHREKQTMLPDQLNGMSGSANFNSLATALESPTLGSDTNPQAVTLTGSNQANFFLGYAGDYSVLLTRGFYYYTNRNAAVYVQDNWKATPRLTVTYGLRWDINPALTDEKYLINSFDLKNHAIVLPQPMDYYYRIGATTPKVVSQYQALGVKFESAADAGRDTNVFQSNLFDLGPRAGIAYRVLDGKKSFVIRGGYGLYISPIPMRNLFVQFYNAIPFRTTYQYNANSAAYSPDGIPNYLLRNAPTYVAGVNTSCKGGCDPKFIDTNNAAAVGRGPGVNAMGPLPSLKIHEWNVTLEKQTGASTVFRVRYSGRHGYNADQLNNINPQQTNYNWYMTTGTALPTGTYSSVARRPYDSTAYGNVILIQKTGMINTSTFSAEIERRFSKGLQFQVFQTLTNSLRMAGNTFRDGTGYPPEYYLPGTVPTDWNQLNRFVNYQRDTAIPKHRTRWNWTYDLPVGRGKPIARNAPAWLNNLIGGWRVAGTGTLLSSWFALPTGDWGAINGPVEVYGKKYPILDCRTTPAAAKTPQEERCFAGYLYFNGYISQRFINSRNTYGMRNGVVGLPDNYVPAQTPVTPWPKGGVSGSAGSSNWDTDNVYIPLKDGSTVLVAKDTGLHPWRQQYRLGPFNWTTDTSLEKRFVLKERLTLKMHFDVFNIFNRQGLNTPGADGIVTLQNSYSGSGIRPRQVQVNARLEW